MTITPDNFLAVMDQAIADLKALPEDPLKGATVLWVHPDTAKKARMIAEAAARPIHVQISQYSVPNVIAGFRGSECVCLIKLEK